MSENNKIPQIIEKATGFDCAIKLMGYTIILMLVNSCVDKISEPKLKEQEKFYKEIMQQQCRERVTEKILEAIKELSLSDNPNANEGIKSIQTMQQRLLDNCNSFIITNKSAYNAK